MHFYDCKDNIKPKHRNIIQVENLSEPQTLNPKQTHLELSCAIIDYCLCRTRIIMLQLPQASCSEPLPKWADDACFGPVWRLKDATGNWDLHEFGVSSRGWGCGWIVIGIRSCCRGGSAGR